MVPKQLKFVTQKTFDRKCDQLEKTIAEKNDAIEKLEAEKADLAANVPLTERGIYILRRYSDLKNRDFDLQKIAYQQASDWIRMVNSITWTLGSIYLVGAIIALNSAAQSRDPMWRIIVGLSVVVFGVVWLLVDWVYSRSAKAAREFTISLETEWNCKLAFYSNQKKEASLRKLVSVLIYLPAIGVIWFGLVMAKLSLPNALQKLVTSIASPI